MPGLDIFGLDRERKIELSGARKVFTPHQPIRCGTLFWGRQKEVQKIIEHLNTPGQHAVLYGDRGVGKSSLANIATEALLSKIIDGKIYSKRCDSQDSFESIVTGPLKAMGVDPNMSQEVKSQTEGGEAGLKIPVAKAGVHTEKTNEKTFHQQKLTPSVVAEYLKDFPGLLVIDEADALANKEDKLRLAELIKQLSDNGSPFKLLVVGIADTAEALTAGHTSVQRCLKETKLQRMKPLELSLIVTEGAKKLKITFDEKVVAAIVRLSAGYPHFTHLLALKCTEEAVANDKKHIVLEDLTNAMQLAVEDAEGTLLRKYESAIRSYSTDTYQKIVLAAANLNRDEFSAGQLRAAFVELTKQNITQASLNNFLKRLISDDIDTILIRKAKGIYRFSDPRMPSFVKIANRRVE